MRRSPLLGGHLPRSRVWSTHRYRRVAVTKDFRKDALELLAFLGVMTRAIRCWPSSYHGVQRLGFRRSEEHTSELQSLMRISYAVFCLKKKIYNQMHSSQKI